MEATGSWVVKRLSEIHATGGDKTVAVVVTKKEVKEASANVAFLGHLAKSKEFRQDLNLTNAYWHYHQESLRRVLLIQVTEVNKQELRKAGVKTAQELQAKKSDNAEVIVSDAIDAELLGIFANSFYLTNYEFTMKTDPASRD